MELNVREFLHRPVPQLPSHSSCLAVTPRGLNRHKLLSSSFRIRPGDRPTSWPAYSGSILVAYKVIQWWSKIVRVPTRLSEPKP